MYSFDENIAMEFGVEEAVMIQNIYFWIQKNEANNKHFYDGTYWTYNSLEAFQKLFKFWTLKQIRRILKSIEDKGGLVKGNYNKSKYDRTVWYSLTEKTLSICQNRKIDLPIWANGNAQKGTPIPYINTDIKTDIKNIYIEHNENEQQLDKIINIDLQQIEKNKYKNNRSSIDDQKESENNKTIEDIFEKLWSLYPNKKGKGKVNLACKKKLAKIGLETLVKCIERYKQDKPDWQVYQHGSTFFNSGYIDFLDENYKQKSDTKGDDPIAKHLSRLREVF